MKVAWGRGIFLQDRGVNNAHAGKPAMLTFPACRKVVFEIKPLFSERCHGGTVNLEAFPSCIISLISASKGGTKSVHR